MNDTNMNLISIDGNQQHLYLPRRKEKASFLFVLYD